MREKLKRVSWELNSAPGDESRGGPSEHRPWQGTDITRGPLFGITGGPGPSQSLTHNHDFAENVCSNVYTQAFTRAHIHTLVHTLWQRPRSAFSNSELGEHRVQG